MGGLWRFWARDLRTTYRFIRVDTETSARLSDCWRAVGTTYRSIRVDIERRQLLHLSWLRTRTAYRSIRAATPTAWHVFHYPRPKCCARLRLKMCCPMCLYPIAPLPDSSPGNQRRWLLPPSPITSIHQLESPSCPGVWGARHRPDAYEHQLVPGAAVHLSRFGLAACHATDSHPLHRPGRRRNAPHGLADAAANADTPGCTKRPHDDYCQPAQRSPAAELGQRWISP